MTFRIRLQRRGPRR